ncbi:MAG: universal stress protein [Bacteroidota bacterium]
MLPLNHSETPTFTQASILCAIDFSEGSREALKSAIYMADQYKTPLTVLYPYRLNQLEKQTDVSQLRKKMDLDAVKNFSELTDRYLKETGVACEFRAEVGFLQDRIQAFTKRNRIGLVVLSKKLVVNNKDGLLELLEQIQVPLLIVP